MSSFLDELGKKLADRWVTALLLPGLLWTATAVLATHLGWRHALAVAIATADITRWAGQARTTGQTVLVLLALLLISSAVGLAATGLGYLVRLWWHDPGRRCPGRWLSRWRQRRWRRVTNALDTAASDAAAAAGAPGSSPTGPAAPGRSVARLPAADIRAPRAMWRLRARRDAIGLEPPRRPTWIGDRWQANATRIDRAYGLDITLAWPRLWTVLPDSLRADIAAANTAYITASTLAGWAVLYALLGITWWPALLIGAGTTAVAVARARDATSTLCLLVETAADLHLHTLAEQLKLPATDAHRELGRTITTHLRKSAPST
jgi:hypothetical protein